MVLDSVHAASLASPLYGGEFAERVRLSSLLDADGAFVVLRRQKSVTGTERCFGPSLQVCMTDFDGSDGVKVTEIGVLPSGLASLEDGRVQI